MNNITFCNTPMHTLTMSETVDVIKQRIQAGTFTQHVVVNVAKLVHMQSDPYLNRSVRSCDIINIDGMGVVFGARLLGHDVPERVAGVDLFSNLLRMSSENGYPVFFLGATDDVVAEVCRRSVSTYPKLKVVGYHHGYFWDDELAIVNKIRASGARLLFVAITSPKKENFIDKWKDQLGVDFVMGVGGTFDVVAGKVTRAPVWLQNIGFEWLYRVLQEPKRMWKRYLKTNALFVWLLFKEISHL